MVKPTVEVPGKEEMVEVQLSEATHAQLMWFSKQQNLDVDEAETQNQTYSRLKLAWPHPTIMVPAEIEVQTAPKPVRMRPEGADSKNRYGLPEFVQVRVHSSSSFGDDDEDEIKVSHNGVAYRIKKGEVVTLPWYVYKILEDAQALVYPTGRDTGIGEPRVVQAVSFTRIS